jgi:hypothetical protein
MTVNFGKLVNELAGIASDATNACIRQVRNCANNVSLMPQGKINETAIKALKIGVAVGVVAFVAGSHPILFGLGAAAFVAYKSTNNYNVFRAAGDHLSGFANDLAKSFKL